MPASTPINLQGNAAIGTASWTGQISLHKLMPRSKTKGLHSVCTLTWHSSQSKMYQHRLLWDWMALLTLFFCPAGRFSLMSCSNFWSRCICPVTSSITASGALSCLLLCNFICKLPSLQTSSSANLYGMLNPET